MATPESAQRIDLVHENFTWARELRPDGVTNFYRHAMLYAQIQNKNKAALPSASPACKYFMVIIPNGNNT